MLVDTHELAQRFEQEFFVPDVSVKIKDERIFLFRRACGEDLDFDEEASVLIGSYPDQGVVIGKYTLLPPEGMDRSGASDTLWGMVRECLRNLQFRS